MPRSQATRAKVSVHGAPAGSVLCGSGMNNQGLRLRVVQTQTSGIDGPIRGGFVILNVGDNKHSETLAPLVDQITNAFEVLERIRKRHPGCVNVANANNLVSEST
jgi:hypothetical protein